MRFERLLPIIIAIVALSTACTSSPTLKTSSQPAAATAVTMDAVTHSGWWLRVCPRQTETAGIELTVGSDAGHTKPLTWMAGDPPEIAIPAEYQNGASLYVRVLVPDRRIAHLCVIDTSTSRKQIVTDGEAIVTVANSDLERCVCYP